MEKAPPAINRDQVIRDLRKNIKQIKKENFVLSTQTLVSDQLKYLFYKCVKAAYGSNDEPFNPKGLSIQQKTMLLMNFITNRPVLNLLYNKMREF